MTANQLSVRYGGEYIYSQSELVSAILADIEKKKENCYRHFEVIYTTHYSTESEEKKVGIAAFEHVMQLLQSEHGCTVRQEPEYVGDLNAAPAFNTWINKWIIYWGPHCPHCGKATG